MLVRDFRVRRLERTLLLGVEDERFESIPPTLAILNIILAPSHLRMFIPERSLFRKSSLRALDTSDAKSEEDRTAFASIRVGAQAGIFVSRFRTRVTGVTGQHTGPIHGYDPLYDLG